jgi:hypothetical protein
VFLLDYEGHSGGAINAIGGRHFLFLFAFTFSSFAIMTKNNNLGFWILDALLRLVVRFGTTSM